jgi:hypothetical protein
MWLSMELILLESTKAREEIDSCTRCYCILFYHRFHTPYFFGSIRVKKRSLEVVLAIDHWLMAVSLDNIELVMVSQELPVAQFPVLVTIRILCRKIRNV